MNSQHILQQGLHNSVIFYNQRENSYCSLICSVAHVLVPKVEDRNYCGSKCTAINGGTVTKKAFVWFWVRNRMPSERLWKKCMEFEEANFTGKREKHFVDPEKGTVHKVNNF